MKLHWFSLVFIVAGLILHLATPIRGDHSSAYGSGYKVGEWLGGLLIAWILGLLGYYCARRSNLVLNIILCLVMSIRVVGDGLTLLRTKDRETMARVQAAAEEAKKTQKEANERGDYEASAKASEALVSEMRSSASSMSPKQRAIVEGSAAFVELMGAKGREFSKTLEAWQATGGMAATAGLTEAGVDQRLKALAVAKASAVEMRVFVGSLHDQMTADFKKRGLSDEDANKNAAAFVRGAQGASMVAYVNANVVFFDAAIACTGHLKATAGRWTVEDEQFVFTKEEDRLKYIELGTACDQAAAESERLRESLARR